MQSFNATIIWDLCWRASFSKPCLDFGWVHWLNEALGEQDSQGCLCWCLSQERFVLQTCQKDIACDALSDSAHISLVAVHSLPAFCCCSSGTVSKKGSADSQCWWWHVFHLTAHVTADVEVALADRFLFHCVFYGGEALTLWRFLICGCGSGGRAGRPLIVRFLLRNHVEVSEQDSEQLEKQYKKPQPFMISPTQIDVWRPIVAYFLCQ